MSQLSKKVIRLILCIEHAEAHLPRLRWCIEH